MCEKADAFYQMMLKRKAYIGIIQFNAQFCEIQDRVDQVVEQKNYDLVQEVFSGWKGQYEQSKEKMA